MNLRIYIVSSLILFGTHTIESKRHSRVTKVDRYERRARERTQKNTPLDQALSKQTKAMTFDQAVLAQKYYKEHQENDMVIKCGERILAVGGNQDTMRLTRLDLAERFFKKERYKDAEKHAVDYLTFYPGSPDSKRASFLALNATYKTQNNSYKDQKQTRATIDLAQTYLEKYPQDTQHVPAVHEIIKKSYSTLIRSELNIITTHLNTYYNTRGPGHLKSGLKRLEYLKKNYLSHVPQAQTKVLQLERVLKSKLKKAGISIDEKSLDTDPAQSDDRTRWDKVKDFFKEDNTGYFA